MQCWMRMKMKILPDEMLDEETELMTRDWTDKINDWTDKEKRREDGSMFEIIWLGTTAGC